MPKNEKSKKNSAKRAVLQKRELLLKDTVPGSVYGQVVKTLGDCNFQVRCGDNVDRMCHLRKSMKRHIVLIDSVVLVGTRDFQVDKGDIVYVYTYDEATRLKNMHEISFNLSALTSMDDSDDDVKEDVEDVFNFEEI